jgi:hypothetical protein
MMLRTGKGSRYRYYTCSTKAARGDTGCVGRSVPMEKLEHFHDWWNRGIPVRLAF